MLITMDGEVVAAELARLSEAARGIDRRVSGYGDTLGVLDKKIDAHVLEEQQILEDLGRRLQVIEKHLSFAGIAFFIVKSIVLTVVAVITLKFGDISALWKP